MRKRKYLRQLKIAFLILFLVLTLIYFLYGLGSVLLVLVGLIYWSIPVTIILFLKEIIRQYLYRVHGIQCYTREELIERELAPFLVKVDTSEIKQECGSDEEFNKRYGIIEHKK